MSTDFHGDTHTTLHFQAKVQSGKKIEIVSDELIEGDDVEVVLIVSSRTGAGARSVTAFLDSLPSGPRSYATWDEVERQFQVERDAWDR